MKFRNKLLGAKKNRNSAYIIIIVLVLLIGGLILHSFFKGKAMSKLNLSTIALENMRNESTDKLNGIEDEFEVGQVRECRGYTADLLIHKAYVSAFKEERDNCVEKLVNSYVDLNDPQLHYTVKGNFEDGFTATLKNLRKAKLEALEAQKKVDVLQQELSQHRAAQPH